MRFSPDAPIQIGGCGCCTGRGSSVASRTWKCSPSNVNPSVVSSPRTICTASSNASTRSFSAGNGMPSSRCSSSNHAAPYDELEPAARRVVDRDGLGREHRRVAVGHAGDEQAEAHPLGDAAPRGERRVALEALPGAVAVHRLEVVEAPDAVEAEPVGELRAVTRARTRASVAGRCRVRSACTRCTTATVAPTRQRRHVVELSGRRRASSAREDADARPRASAAGTPPDRSSAAPVTACRSGSGRRAGRSSTRACAA